MKAKDTVGTMLAPAPSAPKPETKVPAVPDNQDSKKMEVTPAETAEVKKTEESKVVEPSLEVRSLPSYILAQQPPAIGLFTLNCGQNQIFEFSEL